MIFRKPTVAGVTKALNKMVADLEGVIKHHSNAASSKTVAADKLLVEREEHQAEVHRATTTQKKLADLLS